MQQQTSVYLATCFEPWTNSTLKKKKKKQQQKLEK